MEALHLTNLYTQSLSRSDIRLLTILPSTSSDQPIISQLKAVTLQDAPPYEALSYVWGDASMRQQIVCNGCPLSITSSLNDALRRLRLADIPRTLWADALCINQSDLEEKSRQIPMMGRIYSGAMQVVVWLGHGVLADIITAEISLDVISAACSRYLDSRGVIPDDIQNKEWKNEELAEIHLSTDQHSNIGWTSLRTLFNLPWFRRIWCVQEIRLSRNATVYWDRFEFPWYKIGVMASWLSYRHSRTAFDSQSIYGDLNYDAAFAMYDQYGIHGHMLELLGHYRDFEATDPRDRIYGLLNLMHPNTGSEALIVDYGKTKWEVYEDVALAAIKHSSLLSFLAYVKLQRLPEAGTFASWVPQWDSDTEMMGLRDEEDTSEPTWYACGSTRITEVVQPRPGTLRLRGLIYAEVSSTSNVMDENTITNVASPSPSPASPHPILELWNDVLKTHIPGTKPGIDAVLNIIRTITACIALNESLVYDLDSEEWNQHNANALAYIHESFHATSFENTSSFQPVEMALTDGKQEDFQPLVLRICDQRRIFWMNNGNYGVGPDLMEKGDIVVVLYGGHTPYILRPHGREYLYVGQAFVDDIMFGELITQRDQGLIEEQSFILI